MYPHIFHIYGPIWVQGYGLMIAIGFLLFAYLTYKNPQRNALISTENFFNMLFLGLIAGIIGGRLFVILSNWQGFSQNPLEIFYPWVGGFGLEGTIITILITIPIYLKIKNVPILPTIDLISIYAPLLQAISRIGCFLAGCCYGIQADPSFIFGVTFENPEGLAPLNICLHPTQLYSSVTSFFIFIVLYLQSKYTKYKNGQIAFTYLVIEGFARFVVDFWRGERDIISSLSKYYILSQISYSQLAAIFIFTFGLSALIYINVKNK